MNCERAEEHLSAYLDDMLDPQLREEVRAHLDRCAHCREVLADYRRFDALLGMTPRIEPPAALRDRLFGSPEYAALLAELAAEHRGSPVATRPRLRPVAQEAEAEPELALAAAPGQRRARAHRAPPGWTRVALQTAAVFVLLLGSALLLKQGLFRSGTTSVVSTRTIGNPGQSGIPLAAGARVVYAHDGALWSAPELGPGLAQRLSAKSVTVGDVWSVSADGRLVAYMDDRTGKLHVVRSDGQSDTVIANLGAGCCSDSASLAFTPGLAWSPDGTQLTYVARGTTSLTALHVVNADGTNNRAIAGAAAAIVGRPVWSPDGLYVAFTQSSGDTTSVWAYDLITSQSQELAAQADPANASAGIRTLAWLQDPLNPSVTWAAWDRGAGSVSGLFTAQLKAGTNVERLTPAGMSFNAADFSATRDGGTWLAASAADGLHTSRLYTVSARSGGLGASVDTGNTIREVYWSPAGDAATYVTADGKLGAWTPNGTTVQILSGVDGPVVWSPDGRHLVAETTGGLVSVSMSHGLPAVQTPVGRDAGAVLVVWTPDGRAFAISGTGGVYIATTGGTQLKRVDTQQAAGVAAWSVAG
jgi:Tol biopolymer transport system component/anti-sigma factor RsiW